jgi:hypothetical protein
VIARPEVDPGSVPVFLQLLADPAFLSERTPSPFSHREATAPSGEFHLTPKLARYSYIAQRYTLPYTIPGGVRFTGTGLSMNTRTSRQHDPATPVALPSYFVKPNWAAYSSPYALR